MHSSGSRRTIENPVFQSRESVPCVESPDPLGVFKGDARAILTGVFVEYEFVDTVEEEAGVRCLACSGNSDDGSSIPCTSPYVLSRQNGSSRVARYARGRTPGLPSVAVTVLCDRLTYAGCLRVVSAMTTVPTSASYRENEKVQKLSSSGISNASEESVMRTGRGA